MGPSWAQDVYLREQQSLVLQLKSNFQLSESERIAIEVYERTMVANRRDPAGRVIGGRIHALVRITPLILPVGFSGLWIYALALAPSLVG